MLRVGLLFLISIIYISCKNADSLPINLSENGVPMTLKYAKGFSVTNFKNYKLLTIKSPWPNSKNHFKYILYHKKQPKSPSIKTIKIPLKSIVVTSTTHLPGLELLNVENTLIGFPETRFVSSKKIRTRIKNGYINDLGKGHDLNTEVLLNIKPDAVISFGISGINKSLNTTEKAGIPIIYNGDWVEHSPLAKAEWIKFFGVLYDKEKQADSIFNAIETNYNKAKALALKADKIPTVLSGAIFNDIWYLPSGTSTEAQFLKDANANYLWSNTAQKGSLSLNFESVFNTAHNADIWLNPSNFKTRLELLKSNSHYNKFKAYKTKQIYSFTNTIGDTGGVLYYELGFARPDIVLKDIIKVCHPQLLPNYTPYFITKLN